MVEFDVDIGAARAEESRIESLSVVGCHNENATLLRPGTVKGIEQAGERDAAAFSFLNTCTLDKYGINVFE